MPKQKTFNTNLIQYTKNNLKWIIDLIMKAKAIKVLEENIEVKLIYLSLGLIFLEDQKHVICYRLNIYILTKLNTKILTPI